VCKKYLRREQTMVKNWKRIFSELSVSLLEEPKHLIQKDNDW
jgi:hypothetical protein